MHEETTEEWQAAERVSKDPLREWYTKEIWGKRAPDDDALFEVMSLQVFQAGLTWRMIPGSSLSRSTSGGPMAATASIFQPANADRKLSRRESTIRQVRPA